MPDEELLKRGWAIIHKFERESRSDPFGWDWPTMAMLFPAEYQTFQELRAEWRKRHPKEEK